MDNDEQDRPTQSAPRLGGPVRRIYTEDAEWVVRQWSSVYDRRRPDLVFESDRAVRRVRDYPANWMELSDEELLAVSLGR